MILDLSKCKLQTQRTDKVPPFDQFYPSCFTFHATAVLPVAGRVEGLPVELFHVERWPFDEEHREALIEGELEHMGQTVPLSAPHWHAGILTVRLFVEDCRRKSEGRPLPSGGRWFLALTGRRARFLFEWVRDRCAAGAAPSCDEFQAFADSIDESFGGEL